MPSSSSTVDFSKIDTLIATTNEQEQNNGVRNEPRKKVPYFYVVPVIFSSLEEYLHSFGQYQLSATSSSTDFPDARIQNVSDHEDVRTHNQSTSEQKVPVSQKQTIKKRGVNERFAFEQIEILKEKFAKSKKIDRKERDELAEKLNLTPTQVVDWFRKERSRPEGSNSTPYTSKQKEALKERLKKSDKVGREERKEMAKDLNMRPQQIDLWFRHQQRKQKRSQDFAPSELPDAREESFSETNSTTEDNIEQEMKPSRSYSRDQLKILEERFVRSHSIGLLEKKELAKKVNLTHHQIKRWFDNRRYREAHRSS